MKLEVHRRLGEIGAAQGKEYGKLVQKLLALAFLEAGATRITERSIQGTDLEVTLADGRKIALEVKTSEPGASGKVEFGKKDVQGLEAREEAGYAAYFAVLGNRLLDDWLFVRHAPGEIQTGTAYSPTRLRPYRARDLEEVVADTFAAAVARHGGTAAEGGQGALNEILRGYEAFRLA